MEKSYVGMYNCYYCNEPIGILLNRKMKNTLPRNVGVLNLEPCNKCKEYMEQGIILISISDNTTEKEMKTKLPNPYRTGCWVVLKEEAFKRILEGNESFINFGLKHRFMFITDSAWKSIGLPISTNK